MPTIYNIARKYRRDGEKLVDYPALVCTEARETDRLFKLDGRNGDFNFAINLPKAARYLSPRAAWEHWIGEMTNSVNALEQRLNEAMNLRDMGIEQAEIDCAE